METTIKSGVGPPTQPMKGPTCDICMSNFPSVFCQQDNAKLCPSCDIMVRQEPRLLFQLELFPLLRIG